jgi:chromosome segregation ATPase
MHQQNFDDLSKDEMITYDSSKTVYTSIIVDIQKINAQLETEKIDLEVKVKQLIEEKNRVVKEKENLNKKYLAADQERQKYLTEREIYDRQHLEVLNSKEYEISLINDQYIQLNETYRLIESERNELLIIKQEYEQITIAYNDTKNAYETLYSQANELHNTNQILNNDLITTKSLNEEFKQSLDELNIKVEHLESENSELNRKNIGFKFKLEDLQDQIENKINEIKEINIYKRELTAISELNNNIERLNIEIFDKNELIEQLNQAKDFLESTNSQLLVKNIKMQIYLENINVDYEQGNYHFILKQI